MQAADRLGLVAPYDTLCRAQEYEQKIISTVVTLAKEIASISPSDDAINGYIKPFSGSGVRMPFISHHANPAPIVAVLSKTIESIIQRNASFTLSSAIYYLPTENIPMETWIPSIQPLLRCLLDFQTTIGGARAANVALERLMKSHTDILMDCWTG